MAMARFDIEKLTDKIGFSLWKAKMEALLVQHGLEQALLGDAGFPKDFDAAEKTRIIGKARSSLILSLGDKVLVEVIKEKTAKGVWDKLESLYHVKSSASKMHLKQKLFSFKMRADRSIIDQLDEFNKLCMDIESLEGKVEDNDKAVILLSSLPKSYEHFIDAIVMTKPDDLTAADVEKALRNKMDQKNVGNQPDPAAESLFVKQAWNKHQAGKSKTSGRPKQQLKESKFGGNSNTEKRACFYCKKPGHLMKDCYSLKKKERR